ncbi:MAG: hypothetical protein LBN38_06235 [Verrucomicrobiota bacterium]|jgi:DNA polymerase-3 subunit delta|nr:hypothetical protein [Verrucomicrobiota bacterium]
MTAHKAKAAEAEADTGDGHAPIFLVYGSDDLSALRKADHLVASLCPPEEQAFGLEVIHPEGGEKTADAVCAILRNTIEALLTAPFLGGRKTVYLKGAPFFDPLSEPGRFADVKAETARLEEVLKNRLPDGVCFVLLTSKVNKSTAFYKTFKNRGEVFVFEEPEKEKDARTDFYPRVEEALKERGLKLSGDVLNALIGRTGYNLRQVEMELEKLSLYLGERTTATLEDIQLMVAPVTESRFWDFADSFCTLNLAKTLAVMRRMFIQGISPVALIANLQTTLRDMVVFSDCLKRGWARLSGSPDWPKLSWLVPPEGEGVLAALDNHPQKMNPFRSAHVAGKANRLPSARWFRWLNAAVDAQSDMTGGAAVDPALVLELFVMRTLGELSVDKPVSR